MQSMSAGRACALAFLIAVGALAGAAQVDAAEAEKAKPSTRLTGVVNINTATPEQLELLPGIGPARAGAIIEDRKVHGAYTSVDDLVRVSGIGERALERIRSHLVVKGRTTAAFRE